MDFDQCLKLFNFNEFKSHEQENAIVQILSMPQKHFILDMATQAGKSLCYQLPGVISKSGVTIIFSPSLILIEDQVGYLNSLDIQAEAITGETSHREKNEILNQLRNSDNIRFIFLTPEKLIHPSNTDIVDALEELCEENKINRFVVDEAHKLLDASDFRLNFDRFSEVVRQFNEVQWLALTTANNDTVDEIKKFLNLTNPIVIKSSPVRDNIFYDVANLNERSGPEKFIENLEKEDGKIPSGIIFCLEYDHVDFALKRLKNSGIDAKACYGKIEQEICMDNLREWSQGEFPVLVATSEKLGFGINHYTPVIRYVIHLFPPKNLRSFYQESGRIANDGERGYSRMYKYTDEHKSVDDQIRGYMRAPCKRQYLAAFFGEATQKCLTSCDKCVKNLKVDTS